MNTVKLQKQTIFNLLKQSKNEINLQSNIESFLYRDFSAHIYDFNREMVKLLKEYKLVNKDYDGYRKEYIDEDDPDTYEELFLDIFSDCKRLHKKLKITYEKSGDERFLDLLKKLNKDIKKYKK